VPLDYAQTQNNRAVLLSDLATLPGEDRAARLRQALAACDEALALRRDVPLAYATTQNNRAVLLRDLATLPGEDRAARLRQALADIASALYIFEQVQQAQYLQVGRHVLAGLIVVMGVAEFRTAWVATTGQPIPPLPPDLLLTALARQAGLTSQADFQARLQSDPTFKQQVEDLLAFVGDAAKAPTAGQSAARALADLLIAWIQTPDWAQSEAYLQANAAALLTDEAEATLALLQTNNPNHPVIPQHIALLQRCRALGVTPAYQELRAALAAGERSIEQ